MARKARTWTFLVAALCVAVALGALFAAREVFLEHWYLWQLASEDAGERKSALKNLAEIGTRRSTPALLEAVSRGSEEGEMALGVLERIVHRVSSAHRGDIVRGLLERAKLPSPFLALSGLVLLRSSDGRGGVPPASPPVPDVTGVLVRWIAEVRGAPDVLAEAASAGSPVAWQILLQSWPASTAAAGRVLAAAAPRQTVALFQGAFGSGTPLTSITYRVSPGADWILRGGPHRGLEVAIHFARHHDDPKVRAIALSFATGGRPHGSRPLLLHASHADSSPLVRTAALRIARHLEAVSARLVSSNGHAMPVWFELWDGFRCDWL